MELITELELAYSIYFIWPGRVGNQVKIIDKAFGTECDDGKLGYFPSGYGFRASYEHWELDNIEDIYEAFKYLDGAFGWATARQLTNGGIYVRTSIAPEGGRADTCTDTNSCL